MEKYNDFEGILMFLDNFLLKYRFVGEWFILILSYSVVLLRSQTSTFTALPSL